MNVTVTLMGPLKKYLGGEQTKLLNLPKEATVYDIVREVGLPDKNFSFIMVNGNKVAKDYKLADKDYVVIFPLVSGG